MGQRLAKVITATLGREAPQALQAMARGLQRIPGMASPDRSGPIMASIVLDDRWAHLRDGAYVFISKVDDDQPAWAYDRDRELRGSGTPPPTSSTRPRPPTRAQTPETALSARRRGGW